MRGARIYVGPGRWSSVVPEEKEMRETTGGCLRGAGRVTARCEPRRVELCHCLDCRKHSGTLFFAAAIFDRDAVSVTGETREYKHRHFCPPAGHRSSLVPCRR